MAWAALPVAGRLFESARWLAEEQCFQWVDILTATIYRWAPGAPEVHSVALGFEFLSLATPSREPGRQILADRDTLYHYRWGEAPAPLVSLPVAAGARLNDGIVDAEDRVWVGSMGLTPDPEAPVGKLWCVDPGGVHQEMLSEVGISNGIVWLTHEAGFYVDSLSGRVDSVRLCGGALLREPALSAGEGGEPDGIALAHGRLWAAIWGAGQILWLDLATGAQGSVAVPSRRPSSVAFSDAGALVTTAGEGSGQRLDEGGRVLVCTAEELVGRGA